MPVFNHALCMSALVLVSRASAGGHDPGGVFGPLNVNPHRDVREVRLAVTSGGVVTVAWIEDTRKAGERFGQGVVVKRLVGGQWTTLGRDLNYAHPRDATTLDLALDEAGRPLLAWNENFAHADIHVFRAWTGLGWTNWDARRLGQDLTYAARVRALAARSGEPVLAWGVQDTDLPGTRLYVQTWNGRTWVRLPALNSGQHVALSPSVALTKGGQPTVAWLEGDAATSDVLVSRWNGAAWVPVGDPLNIRPHTYTFAPVLRLDEQDRPVVAWLEDRGGTDTLFVRRWTGRAWQRLGDALNVEANHPAERPSLALGPGGRVVVAWAEGVEGERRVFVRAWTGRGWSGLRAGTVSTPGHDADFASVGADGQGRATLAWRELWGDTHRVFVRQLP